uniref:Leucine-rich repeat-containing protein 15 n=1 Tax=Zeugodacus cucurbitae TaxID=28588 RepID=A0A0A1XPF6_ZEUCU
MGNQHALVLLVLLALGAVQQTFTSSLHTGDLAAEKINALGNDDEVLKLVQAKGIRISTPKVKEIPITSTTTTTTETAKQELNNAIDDDKESSEHQQMSDETLNDLIEASKHSEALADDPRFNKMLPNKLKSENATVTSNKSEENYYDYDTDDYDDEYNYDDEVAATESAQKLKNNNSTTVKPNRAVNAAAKNSKKVEMKPIKEEKTSPSKLKGDTQIVDKKQQQQNAKKIEDLDEDDYDDDDEDDADEDDINDEEEIVYNQNVPCPRYCVCARNVNSYLVATCSRFDPETQKFGSDITDLIVTDVGPKYPILLGPEFFLQMGLKYVSSIKISNCTIEFLHSDAFHGLDELYSVNLTNVGLTVINPNTFSKNKKLRLLTISGNDLSVMSNVHFLLNSSSIEELDLSRNNLMELHPQAFSKLSNVVYINLSQNNLEKIPDHVFDSVETIEELDLSYNALKTLPANVFNRTTLAILHLKYNSITGDLHFGNDDLQQLDLSFNNIKHVHHGMFDRMTGLTNLNLKGNGITKIQADSFLALKRLRHIDLSINDLDQVSSMIFYKNSELDVIRLNDNPRLSQLPTDGFLSYNGLFTVYFLDISNCAIGALGHKTFSTMPHLAKLKLAWNNINNLERDTFISLNKLTELDLSNNLIARLDELLFMNNNELTKLNLAGNPIRKLSVRLFMPLAKLQELDVSDCELSSLLSENQYGMGRKYKFYDTLRSFNASSNQIKRISSGDVRSFKNLHTLDIAHNPLKCSEDFQDFISYVSLRPYLGPNKLPTHAELEGDASLVEFQPHADWAALAHEVCRHQEEGTVSKPKEKSLEKRIEQADKVLDSDAKSLWKIVENTKINNKHKILKDTEQSDIAGNLDDESAEEDENTAEEDKDDEDDGEDNDSEYDEDDDDEDDDDDDDANDNGKQKNNAENEKKIDITKLHDFGVRVEEVDLNKETKDQFLLNKFLMDGDDSSENDPEEEIIIERGRIYYEGYKFLIPIIVIITCLLILMLVLVKIVSIVLRKRGERYRMALLASSNNSIVYQKLSEEIKPKVKEPKIPKVHRYAPINQV